MEREELFKEIKRFTIGLDDTFTFKCTQCGKCCIDRNDILLSPRDMYRISKYLDVSPVQLLIDYCEFYIGKNSNMPIVRLRSEGPFSRCTMLKGTQCLIHEAKPSVCAMYPLGRYTECDTSVLEGNEMIKTVVHYILQPTDCGNETETHTVREWLAGFHMESEDVAYLRWNWAISEIGSRLKKLKDHRDEHFMFLAERCSLVALYLNYSMDEEFLPQFEKNISELIEQLNTIEEFVNNQGGDAL